MTKIVILDAATLGDDLSLDGFKALGELTVYDKTSPEETLERVKTANVAVTNKVVLGKEILSACPELNLICITATGTNNVDLEFATEKGITVKNVKGYSTNSVAQHTFACLLNLIHHLNFYNGYVKSGAYQKQPLFTNISKPYFELKDKVFGVIGLGAIGSRVAELAAAFGSRVVYYSTSGKNNNAAFERLDWEEFLSVCDVISIHAPFNEHTQNLVDEKAFSKMKANVILSNMGRGGIINEKALVNALQQDKISGVALDVFEVEPLQADSVLQAVLQDERVLLSPHIAWAGKEAREVLLAATLKNIEDFYA